MDICRGRHYFTELNRDFKCRRTDASEFLRTIIEKIKRNFEDLNKDTLDFLLYEFNEISKRNDADLEHFIDDITGIFNQTIAIAVREKEIFSFPKVNHLYLGNYRKYAYQILIDFEKNLNELKKTGVNVQNTISIYYFIKDVIHQEDHVKLVQKIFECSIEDISTLIENGQESNLILDIFQKFYKELDLVTVSKVFMALHRMWLNQNDSKIKNEFFSKIDAKYFDRLLVYCLEEEHFIILSVAWFHHNSYRNSTIKDQIKHFLKAKIAKGNAFTTELDTNLISEYGITIFREEILPEILKAEHSENYILVLAELVQIFKDQFTDSEKLKITEMYSENFTNGSKEVKLACRSKFIEYSLVVPIKPFLMSFSSTPEIYNSNNFKLILQVSEKFFHLMSESFKNDFGATILDYLLNLKEYDHQVLVKFITSMDFQFLKKSILIPFKNKGCYENPTLITYVTLALIAQEHYDRIQEVDRHLLSQMFFKMSMGVDFENGIVLNTFIKFSKTITVREFETNQFSVQLILKINLRTHNNELINFTSHLYQESKRLRPRIQEIFYEMVFSNFDKNACYRNLVNVLETTIIESELLPKVLEQFPMNIENMTIFCSKSFYVAYDGLSMKSKNTLNIVLLKLCLCSRIDPFEGISIVKNYNLEPKDGIIKEFSRTLFLNVTHFQERSQLWEKVDGCFEILKKTALEELRKTDIKESTKENICEVLYIIYRSVTEAESKEMKSLLENSNIFAAKKLLHRLRNPENKAPGIAIIFHNDKWPDHPELNRTGSKKDVDNLKKTFEMFSITTLVVENPEVDEISEVISKVNNFDFSNASFLIIVILSHGKEHDNILAIDDFYNVKDIIITPLLSENKTLKHIPKLIFVQACKGSDRHSENYNEYSSSESLDNFNRRPSIRSEGSGSFSPSDLFRLDSTFEGLKSVRLRDSGTPFIMALCESILKYGDDKDIDKIVKIIKKRVLEIAKEIELEQHSVRSDTLYNKFLFGDYRLMDDLVMPYTEDVDVFFETVKRMFRVHGRNNSSKKVESI
ncbi:hypothetical protein ACFFRR_004201 [Megaselia abdita]